MCQSIIRQDGVELRNETFKEKKKYRLTCASKFKIGELSPSSGIMTEVRVCHSGLSFVEFFLLFKGYVYLNNVFDCGDTA